MSRVTYFYDLENERKYFMTTGIYILVINKNQSPFYDHELKKSHYSWWWYLHNPTDAMRHKAETLFITNQ